MKYIYGAMKNNKFIAFHKNFKIINDYIATLKGGDKIDLVRMQKGFEKRIDNYSELYLTKYNDDFYVPLKDISFYNNEIDEYKYDISKIINSLKIISLSKNKMDKKILKLTISILEDDIKEFENKCLSEKDNDMINNIQELNNMYKYNIDKDD